MKKKIFFAVLLVAVLATTIFVGSTAGKIIRLKNLSDRLAALSKNSGITAYPPPPATFELTENEINDGVDLLCQAGYLLSLAERMNIKTVPPQSVFCQYFDGFKIKFASGEFSVEGQLLKPVSGRLEAKGKISLNGERNVRIDLLEAKLNGQAMEAASLALIQDLANQESNGFLNKLKYLSIEKLELSPGKLTINGVFSVDELFCNLGVQSYCAPPVIFR